MVAKPAKTCRMHRMINEQTNGTDTELPDAYWEALADQWETDNSDIGSEFDT